MSKIFVCSHYPLTQPYVDIPLQKTLLSMGLKSTFLVPWDNPGSHLPLTGLDEFQIVKSKHLTNLISKDDIFVSRFGYKGDVGDFATIAKSKGATVFMYDVGGVDVYFRKVPADYLTVKTSYYKTKLQAERSIGPKAYKQIFIDGSLQFDDLFNARQKCMPEFKQQFMISYGLNPDKKLAILTPANPGEGWMKGIQDDYRKIIEVVSKNPDYELMVKGHPTDYALTKTQHYQGKHSWEIFGNGVKIVRAEEGYDALAACDVVLNIRSSLAIEVPVLQKPILNINSHKYTVNWPMGNGKIMKNIKLEELEQTLKMELTIDRQECKAYVKKYTDEYGDGKAYERMAKRIQELL